MLGQALNDEETRKEHDEQKDEYDMHNEASMPQKQKTSNVKKQGKAIKYNKTIFRVGNLNKEGCRVWEQNGKKYMCFWDTVLERYTTCINPMITYKKERN